jgi:hypothetical protein
MPKTPLPFHATLMPGAVVGLSYKLHCRRCETYEEGIPLERIHDFVTIHAEWFHRTLRVIPATVVAFRIELPIMLFPHQLDPSRKRFSIGDC